MQVAGHNGAGTVSMTWKEVEVFQLLKNFWIKKNTTGGLETVVSVLWL